MNQYLDVALEAAFGPRTGKGEKNSEGRDHGQHSDRDRRADDGTLVVYADYGTLVVYAVDDGWSSDGGPASVVVFDAGPVCQGFGSVGA